MSSGSATLQVYSPSADDGTLLSAHGDIVSDQQHPHISRSSACSVLLGGQTEMKRVSRVVHDNNQRPLLLGDKLDTASNLSDIGGGKDISADCSVEKTFTDESRMRGLMS